MVLDHVSVGFIGVGEQVRWHLILTFSDVHTSDRVGIDGETFVWVDDHAEKSGVGLKFRG
jgi:hypothetical protein